LLDLGSGAGFPGIPIALLCPEIAVTLAESQNKKVTFLREVIRTLELKNVEVWAGRAEAMPSDQVFHTVTLRAVDDMAIALAAAAPRAKGQIALLSTGTPELPEEFTVAEVLPLPESSTGVLVRAIKA
jgi:16S rRNA (guanine527-N7)-methyltransferase